MKVIISQFILRLGAIWALLSGKYFFIAAFRKIDWNGEGKHKGVFAAEEIPEPMRKETLEVIRNLLNRILEEEYGRERVKKTME